MRKLNIIWREVSRRLWDRFLIQVHRRPAMTFFALTLAILAVASMVLYEVESNSNQPFWRTVVYLLSGVDVDPPQSGVGELTVSLVVLSGIILVSLLTGYIASEFSRLLLSASAVSRKSDHQIFENHIIIFGWNPKTKAILRELDADYREGGKYRDEIVIVSEKESLERGSEEVYEHVWHVCGPSTDTDVLRRTDLARSSDTLGARVAVVLGDAALPPEEADRVTLLTLLAVEHLHPPVLSLVDAFCDSSAPHFKNADADEVAIPNQYANLLLARAAEFPGMAGYIDELLALAPLQRMTAAEDSARMPVSFYVKSVRELKLNGLTFSDAVMRLYAQSNALAAGILRPEGIVLFPDSAAGSQRLGDNDELVVIATPEQAHA